MGKLYSEITRCAPADVKTPNAGDYSLFFNTADSDKLYSMNSSGGTAPIDTTGGVFTGGTDTYWVSGSTGAYSLKAINDSGLDATGDYAVAEGYGTIASGYISHAEGASTTANGNYGSHAEGNGTTANGHSSHSEGVSTTANGNYGSHAEGNTTIALGYSSHAGGINSIASGNTSFVHGSGSTAGGDYTIVLGYGITGLTSNTTYVATLALTTIRDYANDAAADADTTLANGGLYTTSGTTGRGVYRKP